MWQYAEQRLENHYFLFHETCQVVCDLYIVLKAFSIIYDFITLKSYSCDFMLCFPLPSLNAAVLIVLVIGRIQHGTTADLTRPL